MEMLNNNDDAIKSIGQYTGILYGAEAYVNFASTCKRMRQLLLLPPVVDSTIEVNNDTENEAAELMTNQIITNVINARVSYRKEQLRVGREVKVMDCGVAAINGTYKKSGAYDCVPKYVCTSRYNGRDEEFSIFRCRLTDNTRRWYISIVPMNTHPGTTQDIDFYASLPDMDGFPPSEGWVTIGPTATPTAGRGVDPPPRVLPVHLYPDNIKTLEQFAVFETCDAETVFMYDNRITFQFSTSEIESDMKCRIDQIVRVMKRHPNVKVHLDAHSEEALVAYERGLSVCYSISKRLDDDQAEEEGDEDDGQTPINERIHLSSWGKKIMNQLSPDHPFQNEEWVEVYFIVKDDRKVEGMYLPKRHLYYLGHEPDLSFASESSESSDREYSESESSESD